MIKLEDKAVYLYLEECFEDLEETFDEYKMDPTGYRYLCFKETTYFIRGVIMLLSKSDHPVLAQKYLFDLEKIEEYFHDFTGMY